MLSLVVRHRAIEMIVIFIIYRVVFDDDNVLPPPPRPHTHTVDSAITH